MGLKTFLILLSSLLFLSNCGLVQQKEPETIIQTRYIEKKVEIVPRPKAVELIDVEWYVVNDDNIEEFLTKLKNKETVPVFVALRIKDYENLALNVAELKRYIAHQQEIIVYYESALK